MAIKKYGPTTPGRRGMTVTDYSVLSKVAPERSLLEPMKKQDVYKRQAMRFTGFYSAKSRNTRNCVEQFIGSPRAKSIFSGGVSNGSQRENQNPSAEL